MALESRKKWPSFAARKKRKRCCVLPGCEEKGTVAKHFPHNLPWKGCDPKQLEFIFFSQWYCQYTCRTDGKRGNFFVILGWRDDCYLLSGLGAASPKTKGGQFLAEFGLGLKVRRWVIKKWSFTSKIWCLSCWALLVCFCFLLLVIVAGCVNFCVYCKDVGEKADLHWKVHINDLRGTGPYILWENTVDGRNSVPVDIVDIPLKRNLIQTRMVIGNHPGMQ